jgi:nitroreductase
MDVRTAIETRRAIKQFDASHVMAEHEIEALMSLALLSPTAFNIQHWRSVLVRNPELREAINTKWNVNILEPRDGIGGHCLPKDTRMFLQSSKSIKSKILTAALEVDQDYRIHRQSRVELEVLCKDISK